MLLQVSFTINLCFLTLCSLMVPPLWHRNKPHSAFTCFLSLLFFRSKSNLTLDILLDQDPIRIFGWANKNHSRSNADCVALATMCHYCRRGEMLQNFLKQIWYLVTQTMAAADLKTASLWREDWTSGFGSCSQFFWCYETSSIWCEKINHWTGTLHVV